MNEWMNVIFTCVCNVYVWLEVDAAAADSSR